MGSNPTLSAMTNTNEHDASAAVTAFIRSIQDREKAEQEKYATGRRLYGDGWSEVVVSKEVIGYISVDSGTVMIIDPCYVLPDNRSNWDETVRGANPNPSAWSDITDPDETSVYLNATNIHTKKNHYNEMTDDGRSLWVCHQEWGGGVVASTLSGDGGYPVIAEKNGQGRIVRLIVEFGSCDLLEEDETVDV